MDTEGESENKIDNENENDDEKERKEHSTGSYDRGLAVPCYAATRWV
jgi:hypothetical protein